MYKTLFNYFTKGYALAHKSLDIFFIGFILYLSSTVLAYVQNNAFADLAGIILLFVYISFGMSIPVLLEKKALGKLMFYRDVFNVVVHNIKRLILPIVLTFISFIVLVIIVMVIYFSIDGSNNKDFVTYIQNFFKLFNNWNPYLAVIGSLFVFLNFTPMYFSLENKGFFKSMRESVVFSFKHIQFVSVLIVFMFLTYTLWRIFPINVSLNLFNLISRVFIEYIDFVIFVSSILFYKSTLKKKA